MGTDQMIHKVLEDFDQVRWRDCCDYGAPDDVYEWYYAENMLYVVRHKKLKTYYFVKAKSPASAYKLMMSKINK